MQKLAIIFLFICNLTVKAQNIFPEKFTGCIIEQFQLEKDTTIARIEDKTLINIVTNGFDEKSRSKIRGTILMQIIVDSSGNSCLLSVENNTNIKTEKLNLKNSIDQKLKWNKLDMKTSAIISLNFNESQILVKRFGRNSNGWQEISDKILIFNKKITPKKNINTENNPKVIEDPKTKSIWKLYNTSNSIIPFNMSRSVQIDKKGVVWYCTDEGIVKIDGEQWTVLTSENSQLPKNKEGRTTTTSLTIDSLDRLWIGYYGSIIMYDGKNWTKYDDTNSPLKSVSGISVDKNGVIWFGTYYGLVKYDGKDWKTYNMGNSKLPTDHTRKVFLDDNNILWVATESGLSTFSNDKWTNYNTENSLLPSNSVSCIKGDKSGNIWIGTNEVKGKGGLVKIDKSRNWTVYSTQNSKLPTNTIWDIAIENDILWLGHNNGGLVRFDGLDWEVYNTSNSIIPHNYVCSIAIDKNGHKWIATFGGLVYTTR